MNIFIAYVGVTTLGVLLVYVYGLVHGVFLKKRSIINEKIMLDCPVCTYRYIVDGTQKIHKCPQCNSLNKN